MTKEIIQSGKYVALTYTILDDHGDVVEQHDVPIGFVIEDGMLTVDGNHSLAGKERMVRVTITDVRDAKPGEEQVSGIHAMQMPGPKSLN